jgi:Cdc6-like AAA superfamily ATPase
MDLASRIRRRQRRDGPPRLVEDYEVLSPAAHIDEPPDRGSVFEQLLDHLDQVFDGHLPPNGYVYGPPGAGKSAILTALFTHLERISTDNRSVVYTSTRVSSPTSPRFVYLDVRELTSEFAFYHDVLDALVEETVPEHGIGTGELRDRLHASIEGARAGVVVAVDHVDEPETVETTDLIRWFSGLPSNVSWLAVGRTEPAAMPLVEYTADPIHIEPYRREMLVDVLMMRASKGLGQQALDHDTARRIAEWADGNAHDALTALFIAADRAEQAGRTTIETADVDEAIAEVPRPSASLGRVLTQPANKQRVLRELIDLPTRERGSVTETADTISARPNIDLSAGTVKRFLYELAEIGILERVQTERRANKGRPPSRVELRFPPSAFARLYDLRQ